MLAVRTRISATTGAWRAAKATLGFPNIWTRFHPRSYAVACDRTFVRDKDTNLPHPRAKSKIREAGIPFRIPEHEELPGRLDTVLEAIYAAFAEGWSDAAGTDASRRDLTGEAFPLDWSPHRQSGGGFLAAHVPFRLSCVLLDSLNPPLLKPRTLAWNGCYVKLAARFACSLAYHTGRPVWGIFGVCSDFRTSGALVLDGA